MMEVKMESSYLWGTGRRFNSYADYFRRMYGSRVQKLSVDAGFTCPNRDGTKGSGGCTYCLNDAFNPSYCLPSKSVALQIAEGIEFHKKRYRRADKYLAYFQAYSNTYAPMARLESLYSEALGQENVMGLIIGTRPDCVDGHVLDLLSGLAETHYVSVEYGIESCHNGTLERINRGHTFEDAVRALEETSSRGLSTGAHFIFGLPGESLSDMISEAAIISSLPLTTVKFHQLQIIRGTKMEEDYSCHPDDFVKFTLAGYVDFITSFLEKLNPRIVVERFTSEVPPRYLSAESWSRKRTDQIMALIEKRLEDLDTWQGKLFQGTQDFEEKRQLSYKTDLQLKDNKKERGFFESNIDW
jgi:radical SAM protein (TIGR01212 family)